MDPLKWNLHLVIEIKDELGSHVLCRSYLELCMLTQNKQD